MSFTNRKEFEHGTVTRPVIRRGSLAVVMLAATGLLLWAAKGVADKAPKQVSLYLTVEKGDKLIRGLPAENFRLYVDGHSRDFKLEEVKKPARIALLVEYSRSSGAYFGDIATSMKAFLNTAPKGNWYALATFSNKMKIQQDFTKRRGKVAQAFSGLGQPQWSQINTYDAVYKLLDRMGQLSGRRMIILIGSGFDSMSGHTLDDILKRLQSTNVVIYGIGTGSLYRGAYQSYLSSMQRMTLLQAQNFMQTLAEKSGGESWFPKFRSAFDDVMKGTMQEIESQYKMVYSPKAPADHQVHRIKVEAFRIVNDQREDFKVRVRENWRFGGSS